MKELLKLFYNIEGYTIVDQENNFFSMQEHKFVLVPYTRSESELEDLVNLNEELIQKGLPTARFILNKQKSFLTLYENKKYVLLELVSPLEQEYTCLDMISFADKLVIKSQKSILIRNNWAELWSSKIDYFEYQIRQLGKDKPIIINSFSYYVGLAENAIAYVNNTTKKYQITINDHITLQRKRINFPNLQKDYFNPLNYILDLEVRDIASYFKSIFFSSYDDLFIEVNAYLKRRKLSIYGYQLLYARLLYPSYYFDIYEKIMEGKEKESALLPIVNQVEAYEKFLREMYFLLTKYAPIEKVDWLVNKKEL